MDKDKALGAWLGLAMGDALGQAVRGLKPEAIRQIFKTLDSYADVRPHIGRGIKQYRMQGLYGTSTQMALVLAESLAAHKKFDAGEFSDLLVRCSVGGPETYFGIFRRPESCWVRTLQELTSRARPEVAALTTDFGSYFPLGLTVALFYGRDSVTFREICIQMLSMFSDHPAEVTGSALAGWLVLQLGDERSSRLDTQEGVETLLGQAATWARELELELVAGRKSPPDLSPHSCSDLMEQFAEAWPTLKKDTLGPWIVEQANPFLKQPVNHPSQGKTLTLLPLALGLVLLPDAQFASAVTGAAMHGREAVKLAGLTGLLAGARWGMPAIPTPLQNGLVNFREVRERGEALIRRRVVKGKDLIDMELGLTRKEAEEKKKYLPKETGAKPKAVKSSRLEDLFSDMQGEDEDPLAEIREDPRKWRQFERDKSRKKKDRRQKLPPIE